MSMCSRRAVLWTSIGASLEMAGCTRPSVPADRLVVSRGRLICGGLAVRCAIGRSGVRADKVEGDGATPAGRFPLRQILFRPDRLGTVASRLPVRALAPDDGWCDDPADPRYNTPIKLPDAARHEALWREDGLYDAIIVIGYNDAPVAAGRGSAIFLHVAAPDFAPTDGCVAVALPDLLGIARRCGPSALIEIPEDRREPV